MHICINVCILYMNVCMPARMYVRVCLNLYVWTVWVYVYCVGENLDRPLTHLVNDVLLSTWEGAFIHQ